MAPGELFRRALKIDQLIDDSVDGLRQAGLEIEDCYTPAADTPSAVPRALEA